MGMTIQQFADQIKSGVDLRGRILRISIQKDVIFLNFYNVPEDRGHRGATAENNRMMIAASGFNENPEQNTNRVRIELLVSAFPRDRRFRARWSKPETAIVSIQDFLNGIVQDFEPKL